jgi:hypothetical protein
MTTSTVKQQERRNEHGAQDRSRILGNQPEPGRARRNLGSPCLRNCDGSENRMNDQSPDWL